MLVFGIYLLVAGVGLAFSPPESLRHVDDSAPYEPVRLLGVLAATTGFYYVAAARARIRGFFWLTVFGRVGAAATMLLLVTLGIAAPRLLAVGAIDLVGAAWTWWTLRAGEAAPEPFPERAGHGG